MKKLGIDRPISGEKMPIAPFGSVFWFRVKALAPLFDHGWKHEDFPPEPLPQDGTISHAIERIYPFVAQGAGYYPAQAMSTDYAVARCDSMQHTRVVWSARLPACLTAPPSAVPLPAPVLCRAQALVRFWKLWPV